MPIVHNININIVVIIITLNLRQPAWIFLNTLGYKKNFIWQHLDIQNDGRKLGIVFFSCRTGEQPRNDIRGIA